MQAARVGVGDTVTLPGLHGSLGIYTAMGGWNQCEMRQHHKTAAKTLVYILKRTYSDLLPVSPSPSKKRNSNHSVAVAHTGNMGCSEETFIGQDFTFHQDKIYRMKEYKNISKHICTFEEYTLPKSHSQSINCSVNDCPCRQQGQGRRRSSSFHLVLTCRCTEWSTKQKNPKSSNNIYISFLEHKLGCFLVREGSSLKTELILI